MADFSDRRQNMNAQACAPLPARVNENKDYDAAIVRDALENDAYMWRTAEGISIDTGLSVSVVNFVLRTELSEFVIKSAVPDKDGRTRYTTLSHYRAHAGILRRVLDTLADQVR
jgi:hypothetical protein